MAREPRRVNGNQSDIEGAPMGSVRLPSQAVGGLDDVVTALMRSVVRQEIAHFFDSTLRPALEALVAKQESKASDTYLSAEEAAHRAGITAATIREWVRAGKLPGYRAGRLLRVKVSELDLFLASGGAANVVDLDAEARRILAGVRRR